LYALLPPYSRIYNEQFKKGDIFFNYGCFPQTWEDPTFVHPDAEGCRGDNDPLDVCEIGARIIKCGVSVYGIHLNILINRERGNEFYFV
jgi:inorganic pyrophosphatase